MIRFVRVWHDHCMKRVPCPWTVQVQLDDGLKTFECHYFGLDQDSLKELPKAEVTDLLDPPTLEFHGVYAVWIKRRAGDSLERVL